MSTPPLSFSRRRFLTGAGAAAMPAFAIGRSHSPPVGDAGAAPLLASVYTGQIDPSLCLVSEKFDGVRAVWDGNMLRHRSGRPVSAPAAFIAALPRESLDGELWLGRGRFDALSAIVRKAEPSDAQWRRVRYMVFEMPGAGGSFAERVDRLAAVVARSPSAQVELVAQGRVADRMALQRQLDATVAAGGEGLMLHVASAPYVTGRGDALMKLKPHLDAEAIVVGHRPGAGKYRGFVGALEVEAADGRRFLVGSGLTDALRRDPPPLGTVITYRHRDLTPSGLPRFATYLRQRDDL
jgi:DNA ligase-1